jgi:hypothetical protein
MTNVLFELGPGSEFDNYLNQLERNAPVEKIDLCKQLIGPEGCTQLMRALRDNKTVRSVLMGADEIGNLVNSIFSHFRISRSQGNWRDIASK